MPATRFPIGILGALLVAQANAGRRGQARAEALGALLAAEPGRNSAAVETAELQ